jgi:saccharopine dehydrogenase-like NADP-dependent oxidoreductase
VKRILLLGGSGVFGSRIARLLGRANEAELLLAGRRRAPAAALAEELCKAGATVRAIVLERRDLGAMLRRERPHLVIDASGPFQEQGYEVARAAIAAGASCIDIADGRAFVTGIRALDADARTAGVSVISGASSVPCLSSAAAEALALDLDEVSAVRAWISPGNRAPRGLSVVRAILGGAGQKFFWRQAGAARAVHGWQDLRRVDLPELGRRWLSACEIPDLDLLPERWPELSDATFHAGLELGILHLGLWAMSWTVRMRFLKSLAPFAGAALAVANRCERFGTDRGAMRVEVEGMKQDRRVRRAWTLITGSGDGPWVPAAPAAALARRILSADPPAPGARSAFGALPLPAILAELRALDIATRAEREDG